MVIKLHLFTKEQFGLLGNPIKIAKKQGNKGVIKGFTLLWLGLNKIKKWTYIAFSLELNVILYILNICQFINKIYSFSIQFPFLKIIFSGKRLFSVLQNSIQRGSKKSHWHPQITVALILVTPETKKGGKNPTFLEENCQKTEQITSVVKCHFSTGRAGNVEIIIMAKSIFEEKSCRNNSRELAKKKKGCRKENKKNASKFRWHKKGPKK